MNYTRMAAAISDCGRYRYTLLREWDYGSREFVVIGLNPSTADAKKDDATIRRCVSFAKREGCDRLVMLNLFGLRSTDPAALARADDPVGPENDTIITTVTRDAAVVVAAWGAHPFAALRAREVSEYIVGPGLLCFGLTKGGHPRHPLYLPKDVRLETLRRSGQPEGDKTP